MQSPSEPVTAPTDSRAMYDIGIVIPARNGAQSIHRSLRSLSVQTFSGRMHIAVAVNGSTDDTMRVAERHAAPLRARGHRCDVIQTPPGRAAAINQAELLLAGGCVRAYIDHDAILSPTAVGELVEKLQGGCVHFAALELRIMEHESGVTRCYYRVWSELPYVRSSPVTIGVYAVSASGRHRWGKFPQLASDDKFVRLHFRGGERRTVEGSFYQVLQPLGLRALVHARARYNLANRQLARCRPDLHSTDGGRHGSSLAWLLARPKQWPAAAVFLFVHALASLLEMTQVKASNGHFG